MAWEDEYNDLPGLDKKFRRQEQEPLLGSEQPTEQTEEESEDNPFDFLQGYKGLVTAMQSLEGGNQSPLTGGQLPQGYGDPLRILQGEADEAKQKQTQSMQTIQSLMDDERADLERRRQEMKPRFTQQELDDRRAKSTAVAMLTSTLANIANGIAVGRGGLNATVPDGYQAAYEHWNDVQKRQDMRRAEFDKLTDAINANRLAKVKLEYGEGSAEYKEAVAKIENEKNRRGKMAQTQAEIQGRKEIAQMNNESQERRAATTAQAGIDKARVEGQYKVSVEKEKTNREKVKAENRGVDLEEYRTYRGNNGTGTVTIPDDMDIEDGYLAMANAALEYLDGIQETSANRAELNRKKRALTEALLGSSKKIASKIDKLSTAIADSGVSHEALEAALNTQTQDQDGGTGDSESGAF